MSLLSTAAAVDRLEALPLDVPHDELAAGLEAAITAAEAEVRDARGCSACALSCCCCCCQCCCLLH